MKVLTAGHERKHNACRAEVGGCVSGYTYISRVKSPQNVCRGSLKSAIRHRQVIVHRTRHKANRLVTGALKLSLVLAACLACKHLPLVIRHLQVLRIIWINWGCEFGPRSIIFGLPVKDVVVECCNAAYCVQ